MSDPIRGTDILLKVNTGTVAAPVWTTVGHQRDASIDESRSEIDTSSKAADYSTGIMGRRKTTISLDALYVYDDSGYVLLRAAMRNRVNIQVIVARNGSNVEYATALLLGLTINAPDDGEATYSASLTVTGDWTAA